MPSHVCFQQTPSGGRTCVGRMCRGTGGVAARLGGSRGPTLKTCAARTADSLTPRGSETGKAEALPGTDAVHGSGGQAPVPLVPLDGCKTSQSVSQRPRSLSIFVNPDGKSCWRCDGYDSSFCRPGAQCDSAHTGDGEQPAPVTYTHGPRDHRGEAGRSGEGDRATAASAPGWAVVTDGCTTEAPRRHRSISLWRSRQHRICFLKRALGLEWEQRRSRGAREGWLWRPRERR